MIRRYIPLLFAFVVCALLLSQLTTVRTSETAKKIEASSSSANVVERQAIDPGGRTVMSVATTGLVEVVIFEEGDDGAQMEAFKAGQTPRTAKVFSNVKALSYPLSSATGANFHVRIHHQAPGETTVKYTPGTSEEAMGQLRKGQNLVRNQGTIRSDSLYFTPVYQLVPGTIVKLELKEGMGRVALLKTLDYLAAKKGEVKLTDLCAANPCATARGKATVEMKLDDFDDRYIVAQSEGGPIEFSYMVLATSEVLNYIATCG